MQKRVDPALGRVPDRHQPFVGAASRQQPVRRTVTVGKRDDHPRGARAKARRERVVDLHEPRTLDAVSRYVLQERPVDAESAFVFLVGGHGAGRCEPLSYQALARGFARRLDRLGIRSPEKTPHALRHTHATAM